MLYRDGLKFPFFQEKFKYLCLDIVYTMELNKLEIREQVMKTVVKSGNGGAVWVPRGWLGEEVVVIVDESTKKSKNGEAEERQGFWQTILRLWQ